MIIYDPSEIRHEHSSDYFTLYKLNFNLIRSVETEILVIFVLFRECAHKNVEIVTNDRIQIQVESCDDPLEIPLTYEI